MKKHFWSLIYISLSILTFVGCGSTQSNDSDTSEQVESSPIDIVEEALAITIVLITITTIQMVLAPPLVNVVS